MGHDSRLRIRKARFIMTDVRLRRIKGPPRPKCPCIKPVKRSRPSPRFRPARIGTPSSIGDLTRLAAASGRARPTTVRNGSGRLRKMLPFRLTA